MGTPRLTLRNVSVVCAVAAVAAVVFGVAAGVRAISVQQRGGSSSSGHSLRQPTAITNGLVAWYPLDGNAQDYSGNGNDGTLANFTFDGTTNGWTAGKFGKSLLFNGTGDYVDAGNPAVLRSSGPITVSAWVRVASLSTGPNFVSKTVNNFTDGWLLYYDSGTGKLTFRLQRGGGSYSDAQASPSLVTDGKWHLLTGTYDGTTLSLYVDGSLQGHLAAANYAPDTSRDLTVGANSDTHTNLTSGSIDDVRIYSRALSASEISTLYQGSQPATCDQTCVGYWKLDGSVPASALSWAQPGEFGTTLGFGGNSNPTALISTVSQTDPSSITESVWFKTTSTSGGLLIGLGSAPSLLSGAVDRELYMDGSGKLNFVSWNPRTTLTTAGSYNDGSWHLATAVASPSGRQLYVDGSLAASDSVTFSAALSVGYWHLGGDNLTIAGSAGGFYFSGFLDDVRVYSSALSAPQVSALYTNISPPACTSSSCLLWWKLDDASGLVATDSSGSGNAGTAAVTVLLPDATSNGNVGLPLGFTFNGTTNGFSSGAFGNSLLLAGSQGVDVPTIPLTALNQGFTWAGWVETTAYSGAWEWMVDSSSDNPQCGKKSGSGNIRFDPNGLDTTNVNIADGNWHHLACVYDGKSHLKSIYVDGALVASATSAMSFTAASGHIVIGNRGMLAEEWNGSLDDVRIYSRALTDYEIYDQYAAGR
jgi:hypothetical protein